MKTLLILFILSISIMSCEKDTHAVVRSMKALQVHEKLNIEEVPVIFLL